MCQKKQAKLIVLREKRSILLYKDRFPVRGDVTHIDTIDHTLSWIERKTKRANAQSSHNQNRKIQKPFSFTSDSPVSH